MAIKAYVGIMGSGKTYEVASVVIMNALKSGRRVISNIAGLMNDEYERIIRSENPNTSNLGHIVSVPHHAINASNFWLTDNYDNPDRLNNPNLIQAGDLVVLDEVWRFWNGFSPKGLDGSKMPESVMNFFRMHRQMPDPQTGVTCDIVLISQDVGDLHRQVKSVIEETYLMTKMTAIGKENRYRVDIFHRTKTRGKPNKQLFRTYDSQYFSLYSSHSKKSNNSVDAKEVNIDKRGNVLNTPIIKYGLPIVLIIMVLSVRHLMSLFDPKTSDISAKSKTDQKFENTNQSQPAQTNLNSQIPIAQIQPDTSFRIVGQFKKSGLIYYIVENQAGEIRHLLEPNIASLGVDTVIETKELKATSWTKKNENSDRSFMPVPVDKPPAS